MYTKFEHMIKSILKTGTILRINWKGDNLLFLDIKIDLKITASGTGTEIDQ